MKTKPILLTVAIVAIAACSYEFGHIHDRRRLKLESVASAQELLQAKKYYYVLEQESLAAYEKYYFGNIADQYKASKELIRLTEKADPKTWIYMDWGTYNAEIYARASLAANATENYTDAQEFKRLAVVAWIKRKIWNYSYQQMIAMTPSQDFDKAESELFTMIKSMDQTIRTKKTE